MENKTQNKKTGRHQAKTHRVSQFMDDIRQVNWPIEVLKAVLTALILLLLSTSVIWIIAHNSPGEFTGEKLEAYLLKTISLEIREKDATKLSIENKYSDEEKIVFCGTYSIDAQYENQKVFLCVFERKGKSFWNNLVRTAPPYVVKLLYVSENSYNPDVFQCLECRCIPLDENDADEIYIKFKCHYGNYSAFINVFLQKYQDSWHLCFPDLSTLQEEIASVGGSPKWLELNDYPFKDLRNPEQEPLVFYGIWGESFIHQVENPFWGGTDFICGISAIEEGEGDSINSYFAVTTYRITDHGVFRDPNWNTGELLYVSQAGFDLNDSLGSRWGFRFEDNELTLYGADVG